MKKTGIHSKRIWLFAALIPLLFLLAACKKQSNEAPSYFYHYYPTDVGRYTVYQVDSMAHDNGSDTFSFQLKEVIAEEFLDNEGRISQRIERFKRADENAAWNLTDVWFSTRTNTRVERVEENVRYVRFLFPPKENDRWDGNLYNTLDEEEYKFEETHAEGTFGAFNFDSTCFIVQEDRLNLVDTIYKTEVYATNVGLVEKTYRDLFYAWDTAGNRTVLGVEYYLTLMEYGP